MRINFNITSDLSKYIRWNISKTWFSTFIVWTITVSVFNKWKLCEAYYEHEKGYGYW